MVSQNLATVLISSAHARQCGKDFGALTQCFGRNATLGNTKLFSPRCETK